MVFAANLNLMVKFNPIAEATESTVVTDGERELEMTQSFLSAGQLSLYCKALCRLLEEEETSLVAYPTVKPSS